MKVSRSFVILIGFYEDLRVREASGRAPGGSPGTYFDRFGGFEQGWEVFGRSERVLNGFRRVFRRIQNFFGGFQEGPGGGIAGRGIQAP